MELQHWISTTEKNAWQEQLPSRENNNPDFTLQLGEAAGPEWQGFGGCFNELGWIAMSSLDEADRQAILKLLFSDDGCGFSLNRMPIGASDYAASWYSLNEHDGDFAMEHFSIRRDEQHLLPYIRAAMAYAPAMQIFASPWSPPTWMKYPPVYNYGRLIKDQRHLKAYALYLLKFVQAMRQAGIPVTRLHVQNEVLADQKFPSCQWSGEELRDFIRDHLGPAFEQAAETAEIWLGTINGPGDADPMTVFNNYPNRVLMDPAARRYVKGIGYQWAGKYSVQQTRAAWPEVPIMQTENECGDGANSWDYAIYVFGLLRHYLANDVCGYTYWNMVLEDDRGMSTWGWRQNSMISVDSGRKSYRLNPEFHLMRHFSRFIRPGARRLNIAGSAAGNAVAFASGADRVVEMLNPYPEPVTLQIENTRYQLPPRSFNTMSYRAD